MISKVNNFKKSNNSLKKKVLHSSKEEEEYSKHSQHSIICEQHYLNTILR
jgi:hypothetical protein